MSSNVKEIKEDLIKGIHNLEAYWLELNDVNRERAIYGMTLSVLSTLDGDTGEFELAIVPLGTGTHDIGVMTKKGKTFIKTDEYHTTKINSCCGYLQIKAPEVRSVVCPNCKTYLMRDVNSAINIAAKEGYRPQSIRHRIDYVATYCNKWQQVILA